MSFNWNDGPLELVFDDKVYPVAHTKADGLLTLVAYEYEGNHSIISLWTANGDAWAVGSSYTGKRYVRKAFVRKMEVENMMYGDIANQPVMSMADEELATELRAIDGRYSELFIELQNRGYTINDIDGDELDVFVINRIYKNTVTEL